MHKLIELRSKHNVTQEQLAEKAGISVRTIQRIESGAKLKGYSLDTISKALGVPKEDFMDEKSETKLDDIQIIKLINLSSLPFVIVPLGSIAAPLIIMFLKKKFIPMVKEIVTIQILWTILAGVLILLSAFVKKWLSLDGNSMLITITVLILINLFIIIRNAIEIDRKETLYTKLNFSFF